MYFFSSLTGSPSLGIRGSNDELELLLARFVDAAGEMVLLRFLDDLDISGTAGERDDPCRDGGFGVSTRFERIS